MLKQIRWKLTFSYTAVTMATFLMLEVAIVGLLFWFVGSDFLPRRLVYELRENLAPQVAPYLEGPTPRLDELRRWLRNTFSPNLSLGISQRGLQMRSAPLGGDGRLMVVDTHLKLLAAIPVYEAGTSFDPIDIEGLVPLLRLALEGEENPSRLYSRRPDGILLATAPVKNAEGMVLGALVVVFRFPANPRLLSLSLLRIAGMSLLVLIVPVGIIGTMTGVLFSHPIARRLQRLVEVAEVWEQGELSVRLEDSEADELGRLSSQLNHMAERLQNLLLVQTEIAILEERNRVACALHDTIKQRIFALGMQVAALQSLVDQSKWESARERLAEITFLLSKTQEELVEVVHNMRPATLKRGLVQAVEDHLTTWSRQTGITATFQSTGDLSTLHPTAAEALFLIVREALANVARHSKATEVEVTLRRENGFITVNIADNGIGFTPSCSEGEGVGLFSMEERACNLGGTFAIESALDRGTRITVRVPVPKR